MDDLIKRQNVIDVLGIGRELLSRALDNMDIVGNDREKLECGLGLIELYIDDIKDIPSAQPTQSNADSTQCNTLDCVSRQAAIDIVRNRVKRFTTACVLAVTEIEQLPPAQPRMTCDGCKYANHPTGWSDVCVLCIRNFRNFTDRYEGESE